MAHHSLAPHFANEAKFNRPLSPRSVVFIKCTGSNLKYLQALGLEGSNLLVQVLAQIQCRTRNSGT